MERTRSHYHKSLEKRRLSHSIEYKSIKGETMKTKVLSLLMAVLVVSFISCGKKSRSFVTIGTGGVTGVYYPTGGAISRMINKKSTVYKLKASVESTGGSVYNINAVLSGDLDFGIAQSDRQFQAVKGSAEWKNKGPQNRLRSVFSIYPESVTLIASVKSGITSIKDLKGKRVNLGNPGSGQLQNARDLLRAYKIDEKTIKGEYIKAVESAGLLQDERIDAFFYTLGHPNGSIKEATSGRIRVRIVSITGPELTSLIKKYPYYSLSYIPASLYPAAENKKEIKTIGVKATLITSVDVPEATVYAVTKEVFDNLEEFKKLHPSYQTITKESMLEGLSAPIHKGALKYYREAGLVKYIDPSLVKQ
jgi:uncharacterized protein